MRRIVSDNRQATLREIVEIINVGLTTDIFVRKVQLNLALTGYGSRKPSQVSLLTARHHLQCLSWARDHIGWTLDDWKTVAWSEESS